MIKTSLQIGILLLACISAVAQQSTDTSARRFQAGLDAQNAGQYEQALREYAVALQLDPKNYFAQFNSASCYAELERWQEAVAAFRAALALRPNEAMTLVGLARDPRRSLGGGSAKSNSEVIFSHKRHKKHKN